MSESKAPNLFQQAQARPSKKLKLKKEPYIYFSSEIWDKLSKIPLTKNALKELGRRNKGLNTFEVVPNHNPRISQESLEAIRKIARQGGPDLTDLRGYLNTSYLPMTSYGNQSGRPSRPMNPTTSDRGTKTTGPYDRMFNIMLQDGGIYPVESFNPETEDFNFPANLEELQRRANQPRHSSSLTFAQYRAFVTAIRTAKTEREVMAFVVPLLEGEFRVSNQGSKDMTFSNLTPIISKGLESGAQLKGTPDLCYGAPFERLDESIRKELNSLVVPTNDPAKPIAPNFFLELRSPGGYFEVANQQARYYGALGERAQIALRSWGQTEPVLDGLAHTFFCIFHYGQIIFFSIHSAQSQTPGRQFDYFTHHIDNFSMDFSYQNFQKGIAAYQNLLEYAEEMREDSMRLANSRKN